MASVLGLLLAAIAAISMAVLGTNAIAQVPSYELEGLINGDEKPRVWYSARGHLEADTGNSGAAMHSFRVYGDWDSKKVRLVYKCEAAGAGVSPDWSVEWCPAGRDWKISDHIRRFSMRLDGPEADKYDLTYSCWVAQAGHTPLDRGERLAGEWCGVAHSAEKVWVTRIVVTVRKKPA
jgi:hypothetical protein